MSKIHWLLTNPKDQGCVPMESLKQQNIVNFNSTMSAMCNIRIVLNIFPCVILILVEVLMLSGQTLSVLSVGFKSTEAAYLPPTSLSLLTYLLTCQRPRIFFLRFLGVSVGVCSGYMFKLYSLRICAMYSHKIYIVLSTIKLDSIINYQLHILCITFNSLLHFNHP